MATDCVFHDHIRVQFWFNIFDAHLFLTVLFLLFVFSFIWFWDAPTAIEKTNINWRKLLSEVSSTLKIFILYAFFKFLLCFSWFYRPYVLKSGFYIRAWHVLQDWILRIFLFTGVFFNYITPFPDVFHRFFGIYIIFNILETSLDIFFQFLRWTLFSNFHLNLDTTQT